MYTNTMNSWKHRPRHPGATIIAIDFDGTVVENAPRYPDVGAEIEQATQWIRHLDALNCKLIVWTVREGHALDLAVAHWREVIKITPYGVNSCRDDSDSRKLHAHVFVDDRSLGTPTIIGANGRPIVNWNLVGPALVQIVDAR